MEKIRSIFLAIATFLILVTASAYGFLFTIDLLETENTAEVPENELPPLNEILPNFRKIQLLNAPYIPSKNIYSDLNTYEKEAIRLLLDGAFTHASLIINGQVVNEGNHFLSVNFGTESGVINAVRNSSNTLDIKATGQKGGLFDKESNIKLKIDLMQEASMATTKNEFQSTLQGTKLIKLWDKIGLEPPTITKVLVAPFGEQGIYGGASIESIEFEYACKDSSKCTVDICTEDKKTTQCLLEKAGQEAVNSWCSRSKKC